MNIQYINPKMYQVYGMDIAVTLLCISVIHFMFNQAELIAMVIFWPLFLVYVQSRRFIPWVQRKYLLRERNLLTEDMRIIEAFCSDPDKLLGFEQQEFRFRIIFQQAALSKGLAAVCSHIYTHAILAAQEVCREEREQALSDQQLLARLGDQLVVLDEKIAALKK